MGHTAALEQFGDVVDATLSSDTFLRLPSGVQGIARFYVYRPKSDNIVVTLPDATLCRVGGPVYTIANLNDSSYGILLKNSAGTTIIKIASKNVVQVFLVDNSDSVGTWATRASSATEGTVVEVPGLVAYTVTVGTQQNFDLRAYIDANTDYDGTSPCHVTCTVQGVIGSDSINDPAFTFGTWPTDSYMTLIVSLGSFISGRGGDGGRGGDVPTGLLSSPGSDGGPALRVTIDATLVNNGVIQGGGGGGDGRAYSGTKGGNGGGGGAGRPGGSSGAGGSGTYPGQAGGLGSLLLGGPGGVNGIATDGYDGGTPGVDGGGGTSSAGDAIQTLTGFTLTKTVAGTILGDEVTL